MIVYYSMLLWSPLVYFFYSTNNKGKETLSEYNSENKISDKVPWIYAILVFGYFIFWAGMRTYLFDTVTYIPMYQGISTDFNEGFNEINWEGKSPGFELFNLFFKCFISSDFHWWLMFIAIVSGVCVMVALRKYSIDYFFSSFMFISMLQFTWLMNGMRQFICVTIIFACSHFFIEGKFFKFVLMILLLSTIHTTALIMIPMYFVIRGSTWSWKTTIFILGIILISMFSEPFFGGVEDVLSGTAYKGSTAQFAEDDGVNPIRVAFYLLFPILAFWKKEELSKHYEEYPILPISINASVVTAALYFVGVFTSGILIGRLPIYCELYNLILLPFIFKFGFNEEDKIVKYVFVIILVLFFYLQFNGAFYVSDLTGYVY